MSYSFDRVSVKCACFDVLYIIYIYTHCSYMHVVGVYQYVCTYLCIHSIVTHVHIYIYMAACMYTVSCYQTATRLSQANQRRSWQGLSCVSEKREISTRFPPRASFSLGDSCSVLFSIGQQRNPASKSTTPRPLAFLHKDPDPKQLGSSTRSAVAAYQPKIPGSILPRLGGFQTSPLGHSRRVPFGGAVENMANPIVAFRICFFRFRWAPEWVWFPKRFCYFPARFQASPFGSI